MPKAAENKQFSERETQKRMEDAIRRALNTPHRPNKVIAGKKAKSGKARSNRAVPKST